MIKLFILVTLVHFAFSQNYKIVNSSFQAGNEMSIIDDNKITSVSSHDFSGNISNYPNWLICGNICTYIWVLEYLQIGKIASITPDEFHLAQNYPNPFNPLTTIRFSLPEISNNVFNVLTHLTIYDMLGRNVINLLHERRAPGEYSVVWNGRNARGNIVASGAYFYVLRHGHFVKSKKMVMIK
ncbi:MAG: T9SS type A sorting domain-containing protein [Candidatus Marinimicrobia bacterium]|nr:T9SS type A sorting domain-containing protein [Candidatus Neomarinimicrobiota bacterium]